MGGGLWHPDGPALARLRASIDERPRRWRRVLAAGDFKQTFLDDVASGGKKDGLTKKTKKEKGGGKGKKGGVEAKEEREAEEEAAIEAFAERNKEGALKTRPKGFIPEHRDMALLKLRNFTVGRKVPDGVFTGEGAQEEVGRVVEAMVGFVSFFLPFCWRR